jgi:2-desacetyl-2-hydroxyethyl bacteriochlorophyllide A dehydrogenase
MVWGQHQQYSSGSRVCRVPQGVSDEEAAWLPMAVIAQHGFRHAKMEMGESVVVVGLGMLGQLVVQYCRLAGAKHIIAIDPAQPRLDWAKRHGATDTLAMPVQDTVAEVTRITGGEMADVVFDMTGFAPVFAASHPLLRDFGRIILIGDTGTPEQQHMTSLFMGRNLTVIGAHQSRAAKRPYWDHTRQGELFLAFIQRGWMSVKDLITHRYPFEKAPEAYRMLIERRDDAMGVIFQYDGPQG